MCSLQFPRCMYIQHMYVCMYVYLYVYMFIAEREARQIIVTQFGLRVCMYVTLLLSKCNEVVYAMNTWSNRKHMDHIE